MSIRMAAAIEYDGTPFFGWQRQRQTPTVQAELASALSTVANHPLEVYASGRTDTGVHAIRQVVHFDVEVQRPARAWQLGIQSAMRPGISMAWVQSVDTDFHARYSAVARCYRYRILNRPYRAAIDRDRVAWIYQPLDNEAMNEAAAFLVGEHDFTSFRAAGCQAKSPVRTVRSISVKRLGDEVHVDIEANAFLYHMVRNVVGSLILVGRGERSVSWMGEVLEQKDRTQSGMTAPSQGLYFRKALYLPRWGLPDEVTVCS